MHKKVVTIQDVSCFGKCSATVALPILSAMGVECAVIPTAVLSTYTGKFRGYTFRDLTEDLSGILKHWQSLHLEFDGIYTGYLGSEEQLNFVCEIADTVIKEHSLLVIDPVMGDFGRLYEGFSRGFIKKMAKLCKRASVITPNLTEACFLLEIPFQENFSQEEIQSMLKRLVEKLGCQAAIITSIRQDNLQGAIGFDSNTKEYYHAFREHFNAPMHGTGDIFASVLTGALINGENLGKALHLAVDFVADSIEATVTDLQEIPIEDWYGVSFELALPKLIKKMERGI